MNKRLTKQAKMGIRKFTRLLKTVRRESILPFTETPSEEHTAADVDKNKLQAADLFSIFTANIIRDDVTFTR